MLDKIFGSVNWLCFLIESGEIRERVLVNYFKGPIIEWHDELIIKYFDSTVLNNPKFFRHFKSIYIKSITEKCLECDHARRQHHADEQGNNYCENCKCNGFIEH